MPGGQATTTPCCCGAPHVSTATRLGALAGEAYPEGHFWEFECFLISSVTAGCLPLSPRQEGPVWAARGAHPDVAVTRSQCRGREITASHGRSSTFWMIALFLWHSFLSWRPGPRPPGGFQNAAGARCSPLNPPSPTPPLRTPPPPPSVSRRREGAARPPRAGPGREGAQRP